MSDYGWIAPEMPAELAQHMTPARQMAWRAFLKASKAAHIASERHMEACRQYAPRARLMALEARRNAAGRAEMDAVRALWTGIPREAGMSHARR